MKVIARLYGEFDEKFGIPRQSGLVPQTRAQIVFEPAYRDENALRGIEGYSHLWLIWAFSESAREGWSPTVRPPRLGGNARVGGFATRSPFRPNPMGLSCVTLEDVRLRTPQGPVLVVGGADLMSGTPIYDIKPYLPHVDSHPDARGGFAAERAGYALTVDFPAALEEKIDAHRRQALRGVLAGDPRPAYQDDPARVYGLRFAGDHIRFTVENGVLRVVDVTNEKSER